MLNYNHQGLILKFLSIKLIISNNGITEYAFFRNKL